MTTPSFPPDLPAETVRRPQRTLAALLLFVGACLVFLPYSLNASIPVGYRLPVWGGIALAFLAAALWSRRHRAPGDGVRLALHALFVASVAELADWYLSDWLPTLLRVPVDSPAGYGLAKLESMIVLLTTIIVLVRLEGGDLASLYMKRGKVRWWLPVGLIAFAFFAWSALYAAEGLFAGEGLSVARVMPWIPWILLFVFSNGLAEETLFRGLLMPRFKPLIGTWPTILVTSVVFALAHVGVTYTPQLVFFMGITLVLGLTWAVLIHKTDSLWGAVLFHAGADIPVLIGIFSTLQP
jgi:membrane protease YdiL (CAAX protease family)